MGENNIPTKNGPGKNGSIITDQSLVLDESKTFYQTLFD